MASNKVYRSRGRRGFVFVEVGSDFGSFWSGLEESVFRADMRGLREQIPLVVIVESPKACLVFANSCLNLVFELSLI